jgi:hypothetical protein
LPEPELGVGPTVGEWRGAVNRTSRTRRPADFGFAPPRAPSLHEQHRHCHRQQPGRGALARSAADPDQDPDGHAEVDVFVFNAPSCTGNLASSFSTPQPLDAMPGVWLNLKAGSVSGELAQSMLVKLALSKPFRAPSFRARFVNVLVKVQSP